MRAARPLKSANGWMESKLRHKIAADQGMKPEKQCVVERGWTELAVFDTFFQRENITRQMWREFVVAQDAEACFDVTSGVSRRACSLRSTASSTGSPSNAMLRATLRGRRERRMRRCSSLGRARQCLIACFQSMRGIIGLHWRRFELRLFRSSSCPAQHLYDPLQHDSPTIFSVREDVIRHSQLTIAAGQEHHGPTQPAPRRSSRSGGKNAPRGFLATKTPPPPGVFTLPKCAREFNIGPHRESRRWPQPPDERSRVFDLEFTSITRASAVRRG